VDTGVQVHAHAQGRVPDTPLQGVIPPHEAVQCENPNLKEKAVRKKGERRKEKEGERKYRKLESPA